MSDELTYRELLGKLEQLTPEQLDQPVQIVDPSFGALGVATMLPCLALDTVDNFEFDESRSIYDNMYHGNDVVLLTDYNQFGDNGEVAYEIQRETREQIPIYGKDGPTPKEKQMNPKLIAKDISNGGRIILENRTKKCYSFDK